MFSRREYAPEWVEDRRLVVIPPSIDPFAAKNTRLLATPTVERRPAPGRGWSRAAADRARCDFVRRDGTAGTADRIGALRSRSTAAPPPADARWCVQVSRWDRLKDMAGVMAGFAHAVAATTRTTST